MKIGQIYNLLKNRLAKSMLYQIHNLSNDILYQIGSLNDIFYQSQDSSNY